MAATAGRSNCSAQHQMPDRGNIVTAERERLLDRGSQPAPAIAGSELKQFDHLPRALLTAMAHVQPMPQPVEGLGPAPCLAPLGQCRRSGQCAGLALQHIQVVLQIEHLLLAAEAAFVASHAPPFVPQLDRIGVDASLDLGSRASAEPSIGWSARAHSAARPRWGS